MRTRQAYEELLARLMASGELTPDMEEDFRRLKDELDEREGMLARYGETYDGENREYEWKPREEEVVDTPKENVVDWKAKYDEMKQRYIDRFMGRVKEENLRDLKEDLTRGEDEGRKEEVVYEDLFTESEER
ncbi:MAG: hypothetical protein KH411_26455 [Klebsiella oxytoca]|nr:hypothetical protein [Klebsiella oxytoca]